MALANDAAVRDGEIVGDPTEAALVVLAAKGGVDVEETRRAYPRVGEVPFDSEYKLMATFHEMEDDGQEGRAVLRQGRARRLARALVAHPGRRRVDGHGGATAALRFSPRTTVSRERAFAYWPSPCARLDAADFDPARRCSTRFRDSTLLALVGIVDPPRKEAKDAIAHCKEAGIRARMITGDHATTAAAIAAQLGIEGRALTGAEFAALSDAELDEQLDEIGVVARVAPEDKVRLVDG